jgi:plastocyanin
MDSAVADAGKDGASDAGTPDPTPLNGCDKTNYQDKTGMNSVEIEWGFNTAPPGSCIKVKKGTKVTWTGSFASHPFRAKGMVGGGTNPIPATAVDTGGTYDVTFAGEGIFGYECVAHGFMTGAIYVVP